MLKFSISALLYMKPKAFVKYLSGIAVSIDNIFQDIVFLEYKTTTRCKDVLSEIVNQNDDLFSDFSFKSCN